MIELIVVGGILGAAGTAVAGGIALGNRYVDQKLHVTETIIDTSEPIIAPSERRRQESKIHHAA